MHVQHITEQEFADIMEDAIDLSYGPGGIIRGMGADVCGFAIVQGMMSNETVLISEFPVRVMPPDPTPEEIEWCRRMIDEARAREADEADDLVALLIELDQLDG